MIFLRCMHDIKETTLKKRRNYYMERFILFFHFFEIWTFHFACEKAYSFQGKQIHLYFISITFSLNFPSSLMFQICTYTYVYIKVCTYIILSKFHFYSPLFFPLLVFYINILHVLLLCLLFFAKISIFINFIIFK